MSRDKARAKYRKAVAVEMRIQGFSYAEIAETLEFKDRSGAWRCVMRALEEREVTAVERYRITRYAQLERDRQRLWAQAELGDLDAINRIAHGIGERSSLLQVM